ncbi:MAG: hypothetical protein HY927_15425 [Elusimicrobia bacterium]|nr:hypothetical protein [Elusimicrobiota bacterium]
MDLALKQKQFNAAMGLYESKGIYRSFGNLVAVANVSLQAFLLFRALGHSIGLWRQMAALAAAYLAADSVNGLVHMYMDHNDDYDSLAGPLIANFHLHHKVPLYKDSYPPVVYFVETRSKVWLVPCLAATAWLSYRPGINPVLLYALVYAGILSSVAEVSHYLAHNSTSPVAGILARAGLLLPKRHHARHHAGDNLGYAFLNGITNPLLDMIARTCCSGYKNGTDLHFARYSLTERR